MHEVARVIVERSIPFEQSSTAGSRRVPSFYRAPASLGEIMSALAAFPEETVLASGLLYSDPSELVIEPNSLYLVVRNRDQRIVDVLFEERHAQTAYPVVRCASGALPLLRLYERTTSSKGSVCLVNSLEEMAVLHMAGTLAGPGSCLVTASAAELTRLQALFQLVDDEKPQDSPKRRLVLADWRIVTPSYGPPPYLEDALRAVTRIEERMGQTANAVRLWRPAKKCMISMSTAWLHNLEWLVENLQKSFGEDQRSLKERDRPLEDDPSMLRYLIEGMDRIAHQPDPHNYNIGQFNDLKRDYLKTLRNGLLVKGLALSLSHTIDASLRDKAALDQYRMTSLIPDFVWEARKLTSVDPIQLQRFVESRALKDLIEAENTAADSARAQQASQRRR